MDLTKWKEIKSKLNANKMPDIDEIVFLLSEMDEEILFSEADTICKKFKGNTVFIRAIIEISNYCKKSCSYCGINKTVDNIPRYRMSAEEIVTRCIEIENQGASTVVLQAGEDMFFSKETLGDILKKIKESTNLKITLSLGERNRETYAYWKTCGADRFLLRFETSIPRLFTKIHPDDNLDNRLQCLQTLFKTGFETGSGFLMGIPSQTIEELAEDIIFCSNLKLHMIGSGPFIPSPKTTLSKEVNPFTHSIFQKVIAVLRLLNPMANIPATTAFDTIEPNSRELLLKRGANVYMPNATPEPYRSQYNLYPGKKLVDLDISIKNLANKYNNIA